MYKTYLKLLCNWNKVIDKLLLFSNGWSLVYTISPLASQQSPARSFLSFFSGSSHLQCSRCRNTFSTQGTPVSPGNEGGHLDSQSEEYYCCSSWEVFNLFCVFCNVFIFLVLEVFLILFSSFCDAFSVLIPVAFFVAISLLLSSAWFWTLSSLLMVVSVAVSKASPQYKSTGCMKVL